MITEDYVSFETAKLLKEKGFDECCPVKYKYVKEFDSYLQTTEYVNDNFEKYYYPCPTLQMAMKWLREVHNLHIITLPYAPIDRPSYHPGEADIVYIAQIFKGIIPIDEVGRSIIKLSPEEDYETAIKYCLENLI